MSGLRVDMRVDMSRFIVIPKGWTVYLLSSLRRVDKTFLSGADTVSYGAGTAAHPSHPNRFAGNSRQSIARVTAT